MRLFDWLFNKDKVQFLGILGERNKDAVIEFKEAVAKASAPVWAEKTEAMWRTFTPQYQKTSSACVAFTLAKIAQILYWLKLKRKVKFSPGWIYRQRTPKTEGMWIDNAVNLAAMGMITEELYPSENMTEAEINSLPDQPYGQGVAEEFAIASNWVELPLDFDTVASTIQATEKGIMLWFNFGRGEWFKRRIPSILGVARPYNHSVTAVDAFTYNGIEYLLVEDSAEISNFQKLISREAFKSMCWLARYPLSFKFDAIVKKPRFLGTTASLQDCLRYLELFPGNIQSTGFYGKITEESVRKFQYKYKIAPITGKLDATTEAKLLALFG